MERSILVGACRYVHGETLPWILWRIDIGIKGAAAPHDEVALGVGAAATRAVSQDPMERIHVADDSLMLKDMSYIGSIPPM